jgi:cysteinyl-tRNA synthetase
MKDASALEKRIQDVLIRLGDARTQQQTQALGDRPVNDILYTHTTDHQRWGDSERALHSDLVHVHAEVRVALADDFDTPAAMRALLWFVSRLQHALAQQQSDSANALLLSVGLLTQAEAELRAHLDAFGLQELLRGADVLQRTHTSSGASVRLLRTPANAVSSSPPRSSSSSSTTTSPLSTQNHNHAATATSTTTSVTAAHQQRVLLEQLAALRAQVRAAALSLDSQSPTRRELFDASDRCREALAQQQIVVEDWKHERLLKWMQQCRRAEEQSDSE